MSQTSSSQGTVSGEEAGGEILLSVARAAIIEKLTGKAPKEGFPEPSDFFAESRGVYVTLYNQNGEVCGSMGTTDPECENLIEETCRSACLAALEDEEFDPVKDRRALNKLRIEVCVIAKPERVDSIIELDPEIYGVVLSSAKRGIRGVMMPDIPELPTVDKQLAAIRRKAGLRPDEHLRIERFRVEKFADPID